jgi:hypothetical protein
MLRTTLNARITITAVNSWDLKVLQKQILTQIMMSHFNCHQKTPKVVFTLEVISILDSTSWVVGFIDTRKQINCEANFLGAEATRVEHAWNSLAKTENKSFIYCFDDDAHPISFDFIQQVQAAWEKTNKLEFLRSGGRKEFLAHEVGR